MFKKNVKIKQLDIQSQKLNSNNDSVLIDTSIQLHINDTTLSIACVPTHIDHLITGYIYYHFNHASLVEISQQNSDYYCQLSHSDQSIINTKAIQSSSTHFIDIINANRQFKSNQSMYHDTGATMSVGAIVNNDEMILFEDISFENALYKLIGHLVSTKVLFNGILLASHAITAPASSLLSHIPFDILICQSAVSATIVDFCEVNTKSLFGFCRKRTYNIYTNFHVR